MQNNNHPPEEQPLNLNSSENLSDLNEKASYSNLAVTPLHAAFPLYQPQPAQLPVSPIVHAPAVPVGPFSGGLGMIWAGLIFNLVGLYPLLILVSSLAHPHYMTTVGAWLIVSPSLFIGTILSGSGVKEKGYQNASIRIFAIVSFFVGILFFIIPVAASGLYRFGIGN